MKIAIITELQNSAIDLVMRTVAKHTTADVTLFDVRAGEECNEEILREFDLVHLGWYDLFRILFENGENPLGIPLTTNFWNLRMTGYPASQPRGSVSMENMWQCFLQLLAPAAIVVDDLHTLQGLAQLNYFKTHLIPLVFDYSKFKPLPVPDTPFTVGVFGNDYGSKRFFIVREACEMAGVEYFPCIQSSSRKLYHLDPIRDVYRHIHVLAHASILDTNSMPVREALLCGRPVLTTRNGGTMRIVEDGKNGYFYDGTVEDLAQKIALIQRRYKSMQAHSQYSRANFESVPASVRLYEKMWRKAIDED